MPDIREYCDRLWNGEIDIVHDAHPVTSPWNNRSGGVETACWYYKSAARDRSNTGEVCHARTGHDRDRRRVFNGVLPVASQCALAAAVSRNPPRDHIFRVGRFDQEADEAGQPRPTVYGQRRFRLHWDRYKRTVGYTRRSTRGSFTASDGFGFSGSTGPRSFAIRM